MTTPRNIDAEIQGHKDAIKLGEALVRLEKNRDFKAVFGEAYFKTFANNLVLQRAMPEMRSRPEMIEANTRKIDAVSEVQHFLRGVHAMASNSTMALPESEQTREDILAEQEELDEE